MDCPKELEIRRKRMNDEYEEVPTEELWEDGELNFKQIALKLYDRVCILGDWKIVRKRRWDPDHAKKKYKQTPTVL
tara:strand:+ start:6250 stop:6477 length:228 start_codon:yes stop_codon:yes gene_type:complete